MAITSDKATAVINQMNAATYDTPNTTAITNALAALADSIKNISYPLDIKAKCSYVAPVAAPASAPVFSTGTTGGD